jgi:pyruvate dehydrogenase E2 component (dihydrolipoamide acetyltransferase)
MATKQPTDHSHFILPDLGEGVHEAELIKWCVSVGDTVQEHQTMAEMETDKALVEVPSPWTGVIQSLNGSAGDIILVGSILVNYDIGGGATDEPQQQADDAPPDTGCVVGAVDDSMSLPASFIRTETQPQTSGSEKVPATPAVRKIARDMNIDINAVTPTGRGGRVTASDVELHVAPARVAAAPVATEQSSPVLEPPKETAPLATRVSVPQEGVSERIPFRGIRRKIAEAMMHSINTTAHFQVMDEADVTQIDRKRKAISELIGRKLSMLPFVMTAVTKALKKHPSMNSTVDDFVEEILLHSNVHLGCAVDTDNGLMVPVIKNADALSPVQLADETSRLAKACRDRSIPREELSGSTFTISNVGSYGGMYSTPIINYPEVGILAIGRTKEQVLTKDGAFYAGLILPLSVSCDHRVVDGAEAARFLRTIIELLENPEELIPTI